MQFVLNLRNEHVTQNLDWCGSVVKGNVSLERCACATEFGGFLQCVLDFALHSIKSRGVSLSCLFSPRSHRFCLFKVAILFLFRISFVHFQKITT